MGVIENALRKANNESGRSNAPETISSDGDPSLSSLMRPLLANNSEQLCGLSDGKLPCNTVISDRRQMERKQRVSLHLDGPNGILLFECDFEVGKILVDLRQKWNALLLRRLRNPGKQCPQHDEVSAFGNDFRSMHFARLHPIVQLFLCFACKLMCHRSDDKNNCFASTCDSYNSIATVMDDMVSHTVCVYV